ncbi:hypothetical protein [Clostridium sardiniense]|uniref:hypothetical protein n=1 Tax=Clostridium sardiniense TaxID=29369 RepID=UPI001956DF68|nr:hypothetical protein [Clostridium sardiniense]MBM7833291.1 hypothetical protein [Clostridium sardiniense]
MKIIWEYKIVRNFAWLVIPVTLGLYESKPNSIQNALEYIECNTINKSIATIILPNIITLKVIGYVIFFIAIVLYFKFVLSSFHTEVKENR